MGVIIAHILYSQLYKAHAAQTRKRESSDKTRPKKEIAYVAVHRTLKRARTNHMQKLMQHTSNEMKQL